MQSSQYAQELCMKYVMNSKLKYLSEVAGIWGYPGRVLEF